MNVPLYVDGAVVPEALKVFGNHLGYGEIDETVGGLGLGTGLMATAWTPASRVFGSVVTHLDRRGTMLATILYIEGNLTKWVYRTSLRSMLCCRLVEGIRLTANKVN